MGYGYWQCKNRYDSRQELISIAQKYRDLHIPIDNIVQDWFWWNTMGEPVFNKNYPDPKGMIDSLHEKHVHLMMSVWPYFRPGSPVYDDMDKKGFFIDRTKVSGFHPARMALYDAFNPQARDYYWELMNKALFQIERMRGGSTRPSRKQKGSKQTYWSRTRSRSKWRALRERISFDDHDSGVPRPAESE